MPSKYHQEYYRKRKEADPTYGLNKPGGNHTGKNQKLRDRVLELYPDYVFPGGRGRFAAPVIEGKKICRECLEELPVAFFNDWGTCKLCLSKAAEKVNRSKGKRTRKLVQEERDAQLARGRKRCTGDCGQDLPFDAFYRNSANWDGFQNRCKECLKQYQAERYLMATPEQKLIRSVRTRLYIAVKEAAQAVKLGPTNPLIGCTPNFLRQRIEQLWWPGMVWDNWSSEEGRDDVWHVDHIIPISVFDLSDRLEIQACSHYLNLQPLWRPLNISKHDKLDWLPHDKNITLPDGRISRPPTAVREASGITKAILFEKVKQTNDTTSDRSTRRHRETELAAA